MADLTGIFTTFPSCETERLTLRALTPADAPARFRVLTDPRVLKYFGSSPTVSVEECAASIERMLQRYAAHESIRWAIVERSTGDYIGSGGFWRIEAEHRRAEIGYELAATHWGRGLMSEAVAAIVQIVFTRTNLHSIEANIDPANTGSRRVLEKTGFVQEGYFRESYYDPISDTLTDSAVFSLLKPWWLAQQQAG